MKKRDLLGMMKGLEGVVKLQTERIRTLEKQVSEILECNSELVEAPKIKTLDQSVFDGHTPDWKWAAVDANGRAAIYTHRPILCFEAWDNDTAVTSIYLMLDGDYDATNWQNSLIERESKREVLEGNERIKKLLAKQKFVIVKVSDDSYEDAADGSDVFVCRMIDESGRYPVSTADENFWAYGIPIDNNGNEILYVNENGEIED